MNTIKPTIGRIVLFFTQDTNSKGITLPAIITHVHSDDCVSLIAFSAFSDIEGLMPGGVRPFTSALYNESQLLNTWCWMDYQKGQAAKTEVVTNAMADEIASLKAQMYAAGMAMAALNELVAALNAKQPASQRLPVTDPTPVQPEPQDLPAGHPDMLGIDGAGGEGLRG